MTHRRTSRPNLLASAQAYIEGTSSLESTDAASEPLSRPKKLLGRYVGNLAQLPEYIMARRTLTNEWQRRGLSGNVTSLDEFAVELKSEIEAQLYGSTWYKPTPERLLTELDSAINRPDFPRARKLLDSLSGSAELAGAFEAAKERMWNEHQVGKPSVEGGQTESNKHP